VASGWVAARAQLGGRAVGQAASLYSFWYYVGSSVGGTLAGRAWSDDGWSGVVVLAGSSTLAALLLSRPAPQLLVLDEPTNNLDLDSVAQLVAALRFYQGALLVASHDESFLAELALDRRIHLGEEPVSRDSDAELSATDRQDF
jgi:hypothetical protein